MVKLNSHKILKTVLLVVISIMQVACATVKHGTTQSLSVDSYPAGATVKINGEVIGNTPLTFTRSRTEEGTGVLSVEHANYESQSQVLKQSLSGAFWGNLLLGGIIGMGVDAITGAWANITPHKLNFQLKPQQLASNSSEGPMAVGDKRKNYDSSSELDNVRDRLDKLKQVKKEGLITEKEYNSKRKELVDGL